MARLRPLYCRHCHQTLYSDDTERCSACNKVGGMVDPADPAAAAPLATILDVSGSDELADLVASKRQEPTPITEGLGEAVGVYRNLKLGCAGMAFLFIGVMLITAPVFWSDPLGPTFKDAVQGICVILVGVLLLALLVLPAFLGGRSDDKERPPPERAGDESKPPEGGLPLA